MTACSSAGRGALEEGRSHYGALVGGSPAIGGTLYFWSRDEWGAGHAVLGRRTTRGSPSFLNHRITITYETGRTRGGSSQPAALFVRIGLRRDWKDALRRHAASRQASRPPQGPEAPQVHRSQVESGDVIVIIMAGFARLDELNDSSLAAHQALAQLVERRFAGTAAGPGQGSELGQAELPRLDFRTVFAARPWILISSIRFWKLFA